MLTAGPGSDSQNPNAVQFAHNQLLRGEGAGVIPRQHLPTDALGLISLYHALSPQIAHAVHQGQQLPAPGVFPQPAPQAAPHPMAAPQTAYAPQGPAAANGGRYTPPTPLPLPVTNAISGVNEHPAVQSLMIALGHAPRGAAY
jgi:hypothetical protein